jgi:hypothetical protein
MNTQFKGTLFKHARFWAIPYVFGIWWRKQTGPQILPTRKEFQPKNLIP